MYSATLKCPNRLRFYSLYHGHLQHHNVKHNILGLGLLTHLSNSSPKREKSVFINSAL